MADFFRSRTDALHGRACVRVAALLLAIICLSTPVVSGEDGLEADEKWPYEEDLKALVAQVDRTYPFFDLKDIRDDWNKTKATVLQEAKQCKTDAQFVELLMRLLRSLRDAHLRPINMRIELMSLPREFCPGVSFMPATKDRVVVMAARRGMDPALKTGAVVGRIDGQDARKFLDKQADEAWKKGGFFSSPQRARLFVYRIPLRGKKGEKHTITIVEGREKEITLTCNQPARGWPHVYNLPKNLTRAGRSCFHAKLPGGFGYLYLRRIDRHIDQHIAKAVEAHPDAKGWVVDLRGNSGGGYGRELLAQFKALRRPVACVIDAGCVSAGETVARDLVRLCDAKLFGATTAGSSSSKRTWHFPSGIGSIVLSRRSRWGPDGRPIEFNGIKPDVALEAVPKEVQQGQNTCIARALEYLAKETSR